MKDNTFLIWIRISSDDYMNNISSGIEISRDYYIRAFTEKRYHNTVIFDTRIKEEEKIIYSDIQLLDNDLIFILKEKLNKTDFKSLKDIYGTDENVCDGGSTTFRIDEEDFTKSITRLSDLGEYEELDYEPIASLIRVIRKIADYSSISRKLY